MEKRDVNQVLTYITTGLMVLHGALVLLFYIPDCYFYDKYYKYIYWTVSQHCKQHYYSTRSYCFCFQYHLCLCDATKLISLFIKRYKSNKSTDKGEMCCIVVVEFRLVSFLYTNSTVGYKDEVGCRESITLINIQSTKSLDCLYNKRVYRFTNCCYSCSLFVHLYLL